MSICSKCERKRFISALLPHTDILIINGTFPMQSPRGHASLIIQAGQRSHTLIMWGEVKGQPAGSDRSRQPRGHWENMAAGEPLCGWLWRESLLIEEALKAVKKTKYFFFF